MQLTHPMRLTDLEAHGPPCLGRHVSHSYISSALQQPSCLWRAGAVSHCHHQLFSTNVSGHAPVATRVYTIVDQLPRTHDLVLISPFILVRGFGGLGRVPSLLSLGVFSSQGGKGRDKLTQGVLRQKALDCSTVQRSAFCGPV